MKRDLNTVAVGVRAIDVGYYNTKFTLGRGRGGGPRATMPIAARMFPSITPRYAEALGRTPGSAEESGRVVRLEGVDYYVGQDAGYSRSGSDPRAISHDYSQSITYKVLMYAALADIAEKAGGFAVEINTLVVGLPCSTIKASKPALEAWLRGEHHITTNGRDLLVVVKNLHVIPQPIGALLDYGLECGNELEGWALVVDPGGGTLDWFCTTKQRNNWNRSGGYPKSMLACAFAVLDTIDKGLRDNYEIVRRVDSAIRGETSQFKADGKLYQISDFRPHINAVVTEALDKLVQSVGDMADLDLILMTGGGARVFADAMRARYPNLASRVMEWSDNPIFSNVRGFHAYGERASGVA